MAQLAASAEAWLIGLKERIHEVEGDGEEAFRVRRQLVGLVVEGIIVADRSKGKEPRGRITYRFEEAEDTVHERGGELCEVSQNSGEFLQPKAEAGR